MFVTQSRTNLDEILLSRFISNLLATTSFIVLTSDSPCLAQLHLSSQKLSFKLEPIFDFFIELEDPVISEY